MSNDVSHCKLASFGLPRPILPKVQEETKRAGKKNICSFIALYVRFAVQYDKVCDALRTEKTKSNRYAPSSLFESAAIGKFALAYEVYFIVWEIYFYSWFSRYIFTFPRRV